jgi:hypothetical protein
VIASTFFGADVHCEVGTALSLPQPSPCPNLVGVELRRPLRRSGVEEGMVASATVGEVLQLFQFAGLDSALAVFGRVRCNLQLLRCLRANLTGSKKLHVQCIVGFYCL